MKDNGWNEVHIGVSSEKYINAREGISAKGLQYSHKHIGGFTINRSQGGTLPIGIAIEITRYTNNARYV